jgi:VIT1/CCC1 family predicted Fe2+/Mn2+ transporter
MLLALIMQVTQSSEKYFRIEGIKMFSLQLKTMVVTYLE